MFYRSYQKGGRPNASVLYEMPRQKGDEGRQGHSYEEWQASYSGNMPGTRNQNVPNWEEVGQPLATIQKGRIIY